MESASALQFLKNKTILVTGATGFLAKVFVEKILRIQPNLKKLYLLVRAEDTKSAMKRFYNEVVEKELFRLLRDTWGGNLESFILEKVVVVAGDISHVNLGIKDYEVIEEMWREIDILINFAATTNFDERYDIAFDVNIMGALHVLNFAKNCTKIDMLLHTSTAYVCGEASGVIPERPFCNGETVTRTTKLDITVEKNVIEEKLYQLQSTDATEIEITSTMKDLGIKRAKLYGWPNTYVFTKAVGEMMFGNSGDNMSLVIIRPTMVTSTYKEPFPGWIEGLRTIDGAIVGYGKGKLEFLLVNPDTIFDLMPADMVVNLMMMAMAANVGKSSRIIYQVGSSMRNPVKFSDLHEISIRYFAKHPLMDKNGEPIKPIKGRVFKTSAIFNIYMAIRYVIPIQVLKFVSIFYHKYKDVCIDFDRKIKFVMRLVELYKPYMLFRGIFDDANVEKLRMAIRESSGEEVDEFNFDPMSIDWEDYIINAHIPGLVRYVVKR